MFFIARQWIISKQVPWFKIILFSLIAGQLAIAILGAYTDLPRLFILSLPFVIILMFSYVDMIIHSIDKGKLKGYLCEVEK